MHYGSVRPAPFGIGMAVCVFPRKQRLSREVLIKTKDIIQKSGYELLYVDADPVFIKNPNRIKSIDRYKKIVSILRRETGLPISIEHDFKFLILLPLEASEKIEVLKQYYGVTHEGQLVVRGIEIRRHDTPKFIKEFQTELLFALFDCENLEEIINKEYGNALLFVTKAIDKILPLTRFFQSSHPLLPLIQSHWRQMIIGK